MSHDHDQEAHHEPVGYGVYFLTWFALLVFTAITVTAAGFHFGRLSVVVALAIATLKASIVLNYFMHLKSEPRLFHVMLLVTILTLIIFIGLTFTDTMFR